MRLAVLRSRWITPASWIASSPAATWSETSSPSRSRGALLRQDVPHVTPSMNSSDEVQGLVLAVLVDATDVAMTDLAATASSQLGSDATCPGLGDVTRSVFDGDRLSSVRSWAL